MQSGDGLGVFNLFFFEIIQEDPGYERNSKGDSDSTKDLATKLLEAIQRRREEDLEKERKLREEQEEIRIMKEIQTKEENERM